MGEAKRRQKAQGGANPFVSSFAAKGNKINPTGLALAAKKMRNRNALKIIKTSCAKDEQTLLDEINHNPQKAITMMKTYLTTKPNDAHAWYLLGKLYQSVGDMPQARHAFQVSRQQAPKS